MWVLYVWKVIPELSLSDLIDIDNSDCIPHPIKSRRQKEPPRVSQPKRTEPPLVPPTHVISDHTYYVL